MEKWTDEQIAWMLDFDNRFYYFMTAALYKCTGKKLGEILEMKWEDIDFELYDKLKEHIIIHELEKRHGLIHKNTNGSAVTPEQFAANFNAYCIQQKLDIRI